MILILDKIMDMEINKMDMDNKIMGTDNRIMLSMM
jgi:hypothetical protein